MRGFQEEAAFSVRVVGMELGLYRLLRQNNGFLVLQPMAHCDVAFCHHRLSGWYKRMCRWCSLTPVSIRRPHFVQYRLFPPNQQEAVRQWVFGRLHFSNELHHLEYKMAYLCKTHKPILLKTFSCYRQLFLSVTEGLSRVKQLKFVAWTSSVRKFAAWTDEWTSGNSCVTKQM